MCMESFFASMKKESTSRKNYATMEAVKQDIFYYAEIFITGNACTVRLGIRARCLTGCRITKKPRRTRSKLHRYELV